MSNTNKDKSEHGNTAKKDLKDLLQFKMNEGHINTLYSPYRLGMLGYTNSKQFYAPFAIEFKNGRKWIIYSTTSLRDRIKENLWDAFNLKRLDTTIEFALLVYPDAVKESEKNSFIKLQEKYDKKAEYTSIDHIISQSELGERIFNYYMNNHDKWSIKAIQGTHFESDLANTLSNKNNFDKWKNCSTNNDGLNYNTYKTIIDYFKLDKTKIESISATSDSSEIGRLPSGGLPKTDVIVYVKEYDNLIARPYTISCKRTGSDTVSVHEYSADKFADVLDKSNNKLRVLLNQFQSAGGLKAFGKSNCVSLEDELKPYKRKLFLWVMGGYYADGTDLQKANYIVVYDNNDRKVSIHSLEEYYNLLETSGIKKHFGTPFSWTYSSGKKGEKIQLKCKVIK